MASKLTFHKAWENIFKRYDLLTKIEKNGFVDISADELKAVDNKEPRLLTKIDFKEKLPNIMQKEGLAILAIKNGLYRIAKMSPFIEIKEEISSEIIELEPPNEILTIDAYNIASESAALDIAAISGMLERLFEAKSHLTIRGRLRGDLEFKIGDMPFSINGVQIEVDGGYESKNALHLIEAKIGYSNNINIRQLLYPHLFWKSKLKEKKLLKSYIFYLQGDIFRFIPYHYDGSIGYAKHEEEMAFRFKAPMERFSLYDIKINPDNIDISIPFPQADRFETVETMLMLISKNDTITKEELGLHFDIVDRQIDYYLNVLKWMKLCSEKNSSLSMTQKAEKIVSMPYRKRMRALCEIVFSDPIANALLHEKAIDDKYFQAYNIHSQSTIKRRLQTLKAWIRYFKKIFEES